jgi:hypothetical protein
VKVVFDNLANFLSISPNQTPVFALDISAVPVSSHPVPYSLPYMYTLYNVYVLTPTCTVCDQLCCEYMATVVHMLSYYEVQTRIL